MKKQLLFALLLLLLCLSGTKMQAQEQIKKRVDIALVPSDFPVNFALFTKENKQFVAYYATDHILTLACRELDSDQWTYQTLDSKTPWDSHNYIALYVDRRGYIHVVGNMHSSSLQYFKSSQPWDIHSMTALHRMTGEEEDVTTYPEFMYGPTGEVLFHYRYGRSGNGYEVFNVLDANTQSWKRLLNKPLIDGEGERNAYMQGPLPGPDGYFHLTWVWRETPDCDTNHTLSYARSKDLIQWESIRGEKVSSPITLKQKVLVVDPTPVKGGLINIGIKLGFDSSKRPLIAYHKYDEKGHTQLYLSRFEKKEWKSVRQTNWDYRWNFQGGGTVVNELLIDAPACFSKKELKFGYHRMDIGSGLVISNEKNLAPLRQENYPNEYPAEIECVGSSFQGMQVHTVKDAGNSPRKFILRWEALSPNRDQKRTGQLPEPSTLQVIELGQYTPDEIVAIVNRVNSYWQAKYPNPGNPFWDNAAYHTGNMAAYQLTGNKAYHDYSLKWAEQNQWMGAKSTDRTQWKYHYGETDEHVLFGDWQICFQTYVDLYNMQKEKKRIARAQEVMEYQMSTDRSDYWWWADGLYMVMPVMTKLYKLTGNTLYLNKLHEYFTFARKLMYDEEERLFYRDAKYVYPKHKSSNGKKDFWARGNGWVFAGLAKVLQDLPVSDPHRSEYVRIYQEMAIALAASQQEGGYWTRSILDPEHAPGNETSGTAFFTYGYLWGVNNGLLDKEVYLPVAMKAWNYLSETALQANGRVGYVQPIGEKAIPGQVVNEHSESNFGTGAFLLAACELVKTIKASTD